MSREAPPKSLTIDASDIAVDEKTQYRYSELDGLRGIASLLVGLNHGITIPLVITATLAGVPIVNALAGVINGAISVDLFFIMSGFFLCGMLASNSIHNLSSYYIRRYIRLIPPAIVSILILYIFVKTSLQNDSKYPEASMDYLLYYADNKIITAKTFALNILFIHHTINPVLWTIREEILVSSIFPLVYFIKNLFSFWWYRTAWLIIYLFIAVLLKHHQSLGLDIFHYLYMFYAGAMIRDYASQIRRLPVNLQYFLCFAAVAGLIIIGELIPTYGRHRIIFDVPVIVFGSMLIILLSHGTIPAIRKVLNTRSLQFLGRISYSFYLMNWVFVIGTAQVLMQTRMVTYIGALGTGLLLTFISTILNLYAANWFYIAIERQAVRWSRYFGIIAYNASNTRPIHKPT
ncbi:MAG: acyltransferase [Acidocella sp.]|nr:acyltransferase [Acidocella sp.]